MVRGRDGTGNRERKKWPVPNGTHLGSSRTDVGRVRRVVCAVTHQLCRQTLIKNGVVLLRNAWWVTQKTLTHPTFLLNKRHSGGAPFGSAVKSGAKSGARPAAATTAAVSTARRTAGRATTGVFTGVFLGHIALAAGFEVGFVPTATRKAEAGGRNLFLQLGLATFRAIGQRRIAELLQGFQAVTTITTLILINRHTAPSKAKY